MAVSLKVNLKTIGTTKTMRFMGEMSISEVAKEIRDKVPNAGGSDHGIFQPGTITQKPRWLRVEKTLRFYDLQSGMEIEYKKKHRQLRVRLLDETVRTFLIDESQNVAALTEHVGYKMGIKNPEEFSFKIDGPNGQDWLNPTISLPEQGVTEDQTVLLKKKFFFNDANVDRSDPVQLHLLYVQSRDAIVSGDHPCTKEEARDLAALQCQIVFGDFNPAKHGKNLLPPNKIKEFLPPQYHKTKLLDKEIIREYQKLTGMSEVNAKYRYCQLCRSLKTYGITCFLVKEKRKKKLVPVLIGVTRHSVMRMDAETKEVVKEHPLPHLKRWAASPTAFTMDFGEYEDSYYSVITNEAEAISQLIAGYIDIILKTRKDAARVVEDDEPELAYEEQIAPVYGQTFNAITTSNVGRGWGPSAGMEYGPPTGTLPNYAMQQQQFAKMMEANTAKEAVASVATIVDHFQNPSLAVALGTPKLPVSQSLSLLTNAAGQLAAAISALGNQTAGPSAVDAAAKTTLSSLGELIASAKAVGEQTDDNTSVVDGARSLSEAIKQMLASAATCQQAPTDTASLEAFRESQLAVQTAATYVQAATTNTLADQLSQNLVLESARAVAAAATAAVSEATIQASAAPTPAAKQEILQAAKAQAAAASKVMGIATALAPGILNPAYTQQIETACRALAETNQALCTAVAAAVPAASSAGISTILPSAQAIDLTVGQLINATTSAGKQGKEPYDFITPLEDTVSNVEQLATVAKSNPALLPSSAGAIQSAANKVINSGKALAAIAPPEKQTVLLERIKVLSDAANKVGQSARAVVASTGDAYSMGQVVSAGQATMAAMQALLADAPEAVMESVAYWAKAAAAQTSSVIAAASPAKAKDPALAAAIDTATNAVARLVDSIKNHAQGVPNSGPAVVAAAKAAAVPVATLLGAAKQSIAVVDDFDKKVKINQALSDATPALQKMVTSIKAIAEASQPRQVADAAEQLRAVSADLEVAVIAAEAAALPRASGYTADYSNEQLLSVCKSLQTYSSSVNTSGQQTLENVGVAAKAMAGQVQQVAVAAKALAAFSPDSSVQKQMVFASRAVAQAAQNLVDNLKALALDNNQTAQERAAKSQEELSKALNNLLTNSRVLDTGELDEAADVLAAEAERMRLAPPAKVTVPQEVFANQAYELVGATKALGAALSSVAAMAQGSPKMMAVAAKTAAASVSPFIDAANSVIATCPDPQANKAVMRSATELANIGARLILSAKAVALGDESQKKSMLDGSAAMQKAMENVLENLSASQPGQKEITEQQRRIMQVRTKVDFGGPYEKQDMRQLPDACRALSDICNTISTVAQTSPEILSTFSARITAAADNVANIARTAAETGLGSIPAEFIPPLQQAVTALLIASACPRGDRNRAVASAKDVTQAVAAIVQQAKIQATTIRDPVQRRNAILATEKLATATVALAQAAKVAMQPALVEATREALKDVRAAISTSGDPAAEQVIEAARAVTAVAAKVIEASSAVNSNPKDGVNQIKLATVSKSMPAALQQMQHAVSALQPAVKECDEAIAEVEYATSELESAGIAVAFDHLEAPGGRTFQESSNELVRATKDIAAELKNLSNPKDAAARARAATSIKANMGGFVMAVKAAVASTSNRQTQESLLTRSKEMAEALQALLNSVRTVAIGGPNDISRALNDAEKSMAILNSALKGNNSGMRDIDEAIKEVSSSIKVIDQPQTTSKNYKQAKVELKFQTQDLVKDTSELVSIAKMNAEDAGSAAKAISARMPQIMTTVREAATATLDMKAKVNLLAAGRKLGQAVQSALQTARNAASDPKNRNLQKDLANAYNQVGQAVTGLLDACYVGTPGERECEDAAYALGRTVADLDASVLFAAAGAYDVNALTGGRDYEACHADLLYVARQIAESSRKFQAATNEGPEQVGAAAQRLSELGAQLSQHCKALGVLGGDKQANLKLIDACKVVETSAQQLIKTGKDSYGEPAIQALVTEAVDLVIHSSKHMSVVAESLAEQTVRGLVEMDKVKSVTSTLAEAYDSTAFLGDPEANAQAVVEAARAVAAATGDLVVGCNAGQEEIVKACTQSSAALRRLFEVTKGASGTTQRSDVRASLAAAARGVAESMLVLIDACKAGSKQKTLHAQSRVAQVARDCADKLNEIVASANMLPGGEGLSLEEDTMEDLDVVAERELSACAALIDTISKDLISRPSNITINIGEEVVPENLTDSILDSSKAIAQATTALVRGALAAQRERVNKLGNPKTKHLYHKDPAWANGLISAAQKVAAVIRELVSAADAAAKGQAEEERLIACARTVAAATAQLVAASRAKADPGGQAQQKLSAVAKAVATATSQLVEAARLTSEQQREQKAINRRYSLTPSAKAELEKQIEILKLEKALEQARTDLARNRKSQYAK